MTLSDLAARIDVHLKRFEASPKINPMNKTYGTSPYRYAWAVKSGGYVSIQYAYPGDRAHLRMVAAERYLAWLDAGNVGRHVDMPQTKDEKRPA